MGFEPTTFCMASRRSSQLSYSRTAAKYTDAGDGRRTAPDSAIAPTQASPARQLERWPSVDRTTAPSGASSGDHRRRLNAPTHRMMKSRVCGRARRTDRLFRTGRNRFGNRTNRLHAVADRQDIEIPNPRLNRGRE